MFQRNDVEKGEKGESGVFSPPFLCSPFEILILCDQEDSEGMVQAGGAAPQLQQDEHYEIGVYPVLCGGCLVIDGIVLKA